MIAWKEWSAKAFAEAEQARLPILLLLASGRRAEELERAFGGLDEAVGGYVPICVDACDRPDLYLRYGEGKPVALLAYDGRPLDHCVLEKAALAEALSRWHANYAPPSAAPLTTAGEAWTGAVGGGARPALSPHRPQQLVAALLAKEEPMTLGALELLLHAAAEWKDQGAGARLARELDAWAGRLDAGGSMPTAGTRSLGPNASLCRLFWDAFAYCGRTQWRDAARAAASLLTRDFYDPHARAFRHSSSATAQVFADENALAILALQRAAAFEPECRFGQTAADALASLQARLYDPMLGMLHRRQEGGGLIYGLLADNAWTMLAFAEAFQLTGHKPHREFADALARFLFQELWDRDGGGFLDRVAQRDDIGLLKAPRLARPEANAAAFEGLLKLHHLKGNANYRRWLEWGLARFAAVSGPDAAGVARVQDLLARGRLDLELIGRPGEPGTEALLTAVQRHFAPRRIVSFVDPDDQDYILAHKLEAPSYPCLFGCGADLRPLASAAAPEGVATVFQALS